MTTIVTRIAKGTELTHVELDANFTNLNEDKVEKVTGATEDTIAVFDSGGGIKEGAAAAVGVLTEIIYPVGTVYTNMTDSRDPAIIFSMPTATWVAMTDRVLVGAGGTYSIGVTGGATTHTLIEAEMPAHTHTFEKADGFSAPAVLGPANNGRTDIAPNSPAQTTSSTGNNTAHNIMQPYETAYMWKRTA